MGSGDLLPVRSLAVSCVACSPIALLIACGPAAPPPLPPPTVALTAAPPEPPPPPPAATTAPAAPEPPPYVPAAPFSIVAEAPGDRDFAVFPLQGGVTIVAAAVDDDRAATLRLAVLDHDEMVASPQLATGLPPIALNLRDVPLVGGRWPDALWLTTGERCEAHAWQPAAGRWEPRLPHAPPEGKCTHLTPWTPGAALAVIEGPRGSHLAAFGTVLRNVPALPPPSRAEEASCKKRRAEIHTLRALPTGEVIVLWQGCDSSRGRLTYWPKGAAKGETLDAEVNLGIPTMAPILTGSEAFIAGENDRDRVEVRFTFASGHLRHLSTKPRDSNRYDRLVRDDASLGLPPRPATSKADGFHTSYSQHTAADEIFVAGHVKRGDKAVSALLLRNRPVKRALVWP